MAYGTKCKEMSRLVEAEDVGMGARVGKSTERLSAGVRDAVRGVKIQFQNQPTRKLYE